MSAGVRPESISLLEAGVVNVETLQKEAAK